MVNKSKILADLSKMAVDAMGTFSGVKKEVETIVSLRVNKIINKMNLVRRDEFEVLKKLVQKHIIENQGLKKKKNSSLKKNPQSKKKKKKVIKKRAENKIYSQIFSELPNYFAKLFKNFVKLDLVY